MDINKMTMADVETRLAAISTELDTLESTEDIEARSQEVDALNKRKDEIKENAEKRNSLKQGIASGSVPSQPVASFAPQMEQKSFTADSKEYRNAWAKYYLCQNMNADERRAFAQVNGIELRESPTGPLTTTSEAFVAQVEGTIGQNNGGVFIPKEVSDRFLNEIALGSPILEDTYKMSAPGITSFPYEIQAGDAEWKGETDCNDLEAIQWGSIAMVAQEVSKTIRVTWKLEAMTPDSFIDYLFREMRNKMQEALATGEIYGTGTNQLNGYANSDLTVTVAAADNLIDALVKSVNELPKNRRMGAVLYVSDALAQEIALQKDSNGDYVIPPINGASISKLGTLPVKVDPFLNDNNFIVGNLNRDAVLNTHEPLSITKDIMGRCRVNDYTAYAIYSNAYKPNAIVFGTVSE